MRERYMIRTIISGAVVEKSKFLVAANVKPRRSRKKGSTPLRKQDQNDRDAVKRLARVINCNFRHGDLWVTLKYDQVRMDKLMDQIEAHFFGEGVAHPEGYVAPENKTE